MDFVDKSSGFADLKNTVDRESAESFGPISGFCQSRSSDCGSDHQFLVGLGQCPGVLPAKFHFLGFWKRLSRDPTHVHVF